MKASYQISVVNITTQATPTNFQQLIQTTLQYPSGVRFWSPTDGWLYGWLESLSSTNQAVIWVKIPSSIPANGVYQIYMVEDSSLNFDGVYWGEAPTLSSSYGQYDNGGNVFNNYWNFAGTSLPSGLNTLLNGGSVTVNNGVTLSTGSAETDVYSSTTLTTPAIVEALVTSDSNSDAAVFFSENDITSTPSFGANIYNGYVGGYALGTRQSLWREINATYIELAYGSSAVYPAVLSLIWGGTGNIKSTYNYGSALTSTDTSFSVGSGWIVGLTSYNHGTSPYVQYQWLRTRSYPPNGVMPATAIVPLQAWEVFVPPLP
jgi:hypothetical protein